MEEVKLKRSISWKQGTAMAIGSVLGSGILILPAVTAQVAGPASIIAWIVMSILAIPLALTLGRLAATIPNAGGIIAYAREAFGPMVGSITGWLFLGTIPVGVPIIALVGAHYIGTGYHLSNLEMTAIAATMLGTSLILNARGIEISSWVQVSIVFIIAGLLLFAVITASPYVESQSFHPFVPRGWFPVGMAAVSIFWCFVGWEIVVHLVEEFQNPVKDVFLSLCLAPVVVGIIYVALAIVTVGTLAYGSDVGITPLIILVSKGFGPLATYITAFLALLITFGGIHMNIAGFSRMVYAQAREGDFPEIFATLHPIYKTPVMALSGLAVVFTVILTFNGLFNPNLGTMIQWPSIIFLVLYMISMASALKLLRRWDYGWWMALVSLIFCIILYPFSGWACLYPPALAAVGWLVSIGMEFHSKI
ncbi:MAG TPA: amino acid permease [Bacillota bacterium]|nr:amino acid permease [Bacillota bacterium]